MTKVIAIFGAGPGLGSAIAHRFGRHGYKVALVARRKEPLDELVSELASSEIEAHGFQADLAETNKIGDLVDDIRRRFGRIDIIEYSPITTAPFISAEKLTPEILESFAKTYLYTPVALIQAVLPEMLTRGDGAILITHGGTARTAVPGMSGVGPIMAATRNYLFGLNGELASRGVFVGTLTNSAVIVGSAYYDLIEANDEARAKYRALPRIAPDLLADLYFRMTENKGPVETMWPSTSE